MIIEAGTLPVELQPQKLSAVTFSAFAIRFVKNNFETSDVRQIAHHFQISTEDDTDSNPAAMLKSCQVVGVIATGINSLLSLNIVRR